MTYAWETKADRSKNEAKANAALYIFYKAVSSPSMPFNDFIVSVQKMTPSFLYYFGQSIALYEKSGAFPINDLMTQFGKKFEMLPKKASDLNDFFDVLKKPLTEFSVAKWTKYVKEGVIESVKQAKSFFTFGILPVVVIVGGLYIYLKFFKGKR